MYERGWGFTLPTGLDMVNLDADGDEKDLFLRNEDGENLLATSPLLQRDFDYQRDPDNDGKLELEARIYAYKTGVLALPGHSAAMVAGYEGTGKALAGSGAAMIFSMHSQGMGPIGAVASTEADYRVLIRN